MPKICENWLHHVNTCDYYAHPTHEIYQVLPHLVDVKNFEIHWVGQYLVNVVLFRK